MGGVVIRAISGRARGPVRTHCAPPVWAADGSCEDVTSWHYGRRHSKVPAPVESFAAEPARRCRRYGGKPWPGRWVRDRDRVSLPRLVSGISGVQPARRDQGQPEITDLGQQPVQCGLVREQANDDCLGAVAAGLARPGGADRARGRTLPRPFRKRAGRDHASTPAYLILMPLAGENAAPAPGDPGRARNAACAPLASESPAPDTGAACLSMSPGLASLTAAARAA